MTSGVAPVASTALPPKPHAWSDGTRMGIALGVVLLASFVVAGRGIGASGAFAVAAGDVLQGVAPSATQESAALADRLPSGVSLWADWGFLQLAGAFVGGALSALLAGRWRTRDASSPPPRLVRSLAGGALMGIGARLAYGCTSGLALSGGALLATGAWLFIPVAFATAIAVTLLARGRSTGAA